MGLVLARKMVYNKRTNKTDTWQRSFFLLVGHAPLIAGAFMEHEKTGWNQIGFIDYGGGANAKWVKDVQNELEKVEEATIGPAIGFKPFL